MANLMTGAEMVFQALEDQGVKHIFGYPGGAVLPIYDELKNHKNIKHILVRHEQGAGHAAEGYARSTGKPGVVLVTSGPGATNVVTAFVAPGPEVTNITPALPEDLAYPSAACPAPCSCLTKICFIFG